MNQEKKILGVIGLGLIGGSIALECKAQGYIVYGADLSEAHRSQSLKLGLVDAIYPAKELIKKSDVIALCIPVDLVAEKLPIVLDMMTEKQVVFDVGSTKASICDAVRSHKLRHRFVAAHPLAGTEFSGPKAAHLGLYSGKKNIICERDLSQEDALSTVLDIFDMMQMQTLYMGAGAHDKHMAYVSHLSHVSAFTLSLTVLDIEVDEKHIFNLASTGFESTVRLAKSNPQTWSSIFDKNSEHLSTALGSYIDHLKEFKRIIDEKDKSKSLELMQRANDIKRVLAGIKK